MEVDDGESPKSKDNTIMLKAGERHTVKVEYWIADGYACERKNSFSMCEKSRKRFTKHNKPTGMSS